MGEAGGPDRHGSVEESSVVPLPLGRDSVAWKVNAEPAVFLGGGRALLMQVAHPGVGAGVEQHSTYASDPWGRLFRTVDVMMKLSFGPPEVSARQARLLEKVHRRVQGTTEDGSPYSALDPALQLWVWATLVDTALLVYERIRPPLRPDERERFYEESTAVAHGCGVPVGSWPNSWDEFREYVRTTVEEDLRVTDAARAVATAAMVPPLPGPLGPAAGVPNRLVTVGLLPRSLREQYGFRWTRADRGRLVRFLALVRTTTALTPAPLRHAGANLAVVEQRPLRIPWLQRIGGEVTTKRLARAGYGA